MSRQIVALGGRPSPDGPLAAHVLGLTGASRPRICFLPTAAGDSPTTLVGMYELFRAGRCEPSHVELFGVPRAGIREHLLGQDAICVSGGNTANMLAVWRVHGVEQVLREAWERGVVLCGWSAGAICWFEGGVTDSFGPELAPLSDGLGFLGGSFCPHYDAAPERRPAYERLVAEGFPAGIAADDGAGVHFVDRELVEAVTERAHARVYRVELADDGARETALPARILV